jgi:hypothetical protein
MEKENKYYDLIISDSLIKILDEMKFYSLVARLLLQKTHDSENIVDNPVNYLSVSKDGNKISYLTKSRIRDLDVDSLWSTSKRYAAKPGTIISKIFKNLNPKDIEMFSNLFNSIINTINYRFKIVSGSDISKYYHYETYSSQTSSIGSSCMKYNECRDFFSLYEYNNHVIKMLIMLDDEDKVLGRSLLWVCGDLKIMDRIYTTCDEEFTFKFKKWATENGYLYKSNQNWYDTLNFENLSTPKREINIDIKLEKCNLDKYPYLDTFKFLEVSTGIVRNYKKPHKTSKIRTISCANGEYITDCDYFIFDDIDRVMRYNGDIAYLDYIDIRTTIRNTVYSDVLGCRILEKDAIYIDNIESYIFNNEYKHLNVGVGKSSDRFVTNDIINNDSNYNRNVGTDYDYITYYSAQRFDYQPWTPLDVEEIQIGLSNRRND